MKTRFINEVQIRELKEGDEIQIPGETDWRVISSKMFVDYLEKGTASGQRIYLDWTDNGRPVVCAPDFCVALKIYQEGR